MFIKLSRYRKLADEVALDASGRAAGSKSLRLIPDVRGEFLHTVNDTDRLDHLALKYYQQPRKWWRICDANPEFFSPQDLLGKEPVQTDRFPLPAATSSAEPPWRRILAQLRSTPGVEDVQVQANEVFVAQIQNIGGQPITVFVPQYDRALLVRYNRLNVSAEMIAEAITSAGETPGPAQHIGRAGKTVVIPPDVVT